MISLKENYRLEARYGIFINLLYMLYDFSILFENRIGSGIQVLMGFSLFFITFFILRKILGFSIPATICITMVVEINSSYNNIFATSYSSFPLTWFLLSSILLLFVLILKRINYNKAYGSVFLLLLLFLLYSANDNQYNLVNALSQFVNIIVFLLLLANSNNLATVWSEKLEFIVFRLYTISVFSFALMVVIQKFLYEKYSIKLGSIMVVYNRVSYGATMGDYSFSTLYIATGIIILLCSMVINRYYFTKVVTSALIMWFLLALLYVNARTGIFALIISLAIMLSYYIIIKKKYRYFILVLLAIPIIAFILNTMSSNRGEQYLLDGSNRIEGYNRGLSVFASHFFTGTGFGVQNYKLTTGYTIPHNLIIQYLAQLGLLGFIAILFGVYPLFRAFRLSRTPFKWALVTILAGSMFIPDIISSHYLTVVAVMVMVCAKTKGLEKKYE